MHVDRACFALFYISKLQSFPTLWYTRSSRSTYNCKVGVPDWDFHPFLFVYANVFLTSSYIESQVFLQSEVCDSECGVVLAMRVWGETHIAFLVFTVPSNLNCECSPVKSCIDDFNLRRAWITLCHFLLLLLQLFPMCKTKWSYRLTWFCFSFVCVCVCVCV